MTSGSWSIGDFGVGGFAASKQWAGGNGKTEVWPGGIRAKWNGYDMFHRRMTQKTSNSPWFPGEIPSYQMSDYRGIIGWTANDDLRVLNKLAESIRGHSFDLGINIAEARKTYDGLVGNVRTVANALLYLKHGNVPAALRTLGSVGEAPLHTGRNPRTLKIRDLSGRWLETQYAFLPLIGQSYEAAKALEAITGPRRYRFKVSSGNKGKVVNISASPSVYRQDVSFSVRRTLIAELIEDMPLNRSLGLTNPLAIAWEVVPWSFVLDWFLPIGSYLSAFGVIPYLRGRFLTVERGSAKSLPIVNVHPNWHSGFLDYAGTARKESQFRFKRTVSSTLSVPMPTFNTLPKALSPTRIANAVALGFRNLKLLDPVLF